MTQMAENAIREMRASGYVGAPARLRAFRPQPRPGCGKLWKTRVSRKIGITAENLLDAGKSDAYIPLHRRRGDEQRAGRVGRTAFRWRKPHENSVQLAEFTD
ncbi:MAG: hypothetical protein JJU21_18555 [Salinarimonas sp.]|nr:hypothetical protein [Salinarimonas sp.]